MKQYSTCGMRVLEKISSFCCCCCWFYFSFLLCVIMPSTGLIIATIYLVCAVCVCVVLYQMNLRLSDLTNFLLQLREEKNIPERKKEMYWVMIDQFSRLISIWSLNIRHNMVYSFFLLQINYRVKKYIVKFYRVITMAFFSLVFLCVFILSQTLSHRSCLCVVRIDNLIIQWMNIFELINQH